MLTTVVFDVGETLVGETPSWAAWAEAVGVPAFTLAATLGGLIVAARAAGMTAAHLRRGPWGVLQDDPAARGDAPQLDTLASLPELLRSLRG